MTTLPGSGQTFSYSSMGTTWAVTIWDDLSKENYNVIQKHILRASEDFDHTYSRFLPHSLVTAISKSSGVYTVPVDFVHMLTLYRTLYTPSEQKLNPLIGFTMSDLGYDAEYSFQEKEHVRATPDLLETVKILSENEIEITEPVLFDFGALGKGYFVDRIASYLKDAGVAEYLVDGSGDIAFSRNNGVTRAGLEDPEDSASVIGVLSLTGSGALCASSGSRRRWANHHHTIDPKTRLSPTEVVATWVRADSAALADALATCFFFTSPEHFRPAHDFEYCIMKTGRHITASPSFNAEFFVQKH